MRFVVLVSAGCAAAPAVGVSDPEGTPADTQVADDDTSDSAVDSATEEPTGPTACEPVLVPLSGTPRAATVVLEPELCECAVLAISQGLPGLVLTYNQGVQYGQGDAVGGWICTGVEGSPTAEVFQGGTVIAGIAYDHPYSFWMVHPDTGVEALVRARITSDIQVQLVEQIWTGCP